MASPVPTLCLAVYHTISFTAEGHKPHEISGKLAKQNIYAWDGHNYAIESAGHLVLMDKGGVVRVGLAHWNTMKEVERTLSAISAHFGN